MEQAFREIVFETVLGPVALFCDSEEKWLKKLVFVAEEGGRMFSFSSKVPLLKEAKKQLLDYLAGKCTHFDLPLLPEGSPFQQRVWEALLTIPYGETRSYKDIALALGQPGASRAVGNANGRNPLPLFIPCHRVIASDGSPGGYRSGLFRKGFLLDLEAGSRSLRTVGIATVERKTRAGYAV
ncbi:methylated-DNA--[protein]-cysteine S-methyltransferase [Desulfobotulus mexicanus]|uniref:Methylated-DNA--protein-cysteine methyltransferase n=1 Tax=Desulfobotulus mexicanus TaxID=2586642 RepID=A0A5S5MEG5_9BACT|nr:methylated-DNA--[protein]-cysteine S-methyltransferase [Desulfobotulus mexicanus]TYT74121.1 methylated-DNA--[protein]-cysteine S-methyltransferase [Desulfobotulus mexicanus]